MHLFDTNYGKNIILTFYLLLFCIWM